MENENMNPADAIQKDPRKIDNPFELAMILGNVLKKDPRLVRIEAARKAYEGDPEIERLLSEYEAQQAAMERLSTGKEFDPHMLEQLQARVDVLYKEITEHPLYVELCEAQTEVNEFMSNINDTIMFAITGERPAANCSHDCSSCGGCH